MDWALAEWLRLTPYFLKIVSVNPEQSAPFVRLVPPYTYGLPTNCTAYSAMSIPTSVTPRPYLTSVMVSADSSVYPTCT